MGFEEGGDTLQRALDRLEAELEKVDLANEECSKFSTAKRLAKIENCY